MRARAAVVRGVVVALVAAAGVGNAHAAAGDLYISNFIQDTVSRLPQNGMSSVFAGNFNHPGGLAFDRAGNLFVADGGASRIVKITPGGTRTTFASSVSSPHTLVFDSAGNLFCSELNGNVIDKFTPDGTRTPFASNLNGPSGLAFNAAGELFEADVRGGTISKFAPNGTKTPFASGLDQPTGVAVDRFGNVFVAEFNQHRVLKFAPDGTPIPVPDLVFDRPFVLLFDPAGNLLIGDNAASVIYSYSPAGNLTIVTAAEVPAGLALEPPTSLPLNISTRLKVLTGDKVLIAGFILVGTEPKKIIVRGMGPSLANAGITDPLADPIIELHGSDGTIINDDWKENEAEVAATGIPPGDDHESSLVKVLSPGSYTVVERGKSDGTGVGVVELFDLQQGTQSSLANISTRGFVDVGNNVMICGFIVGPGNGSRVLVRGLGPSLTAVGVTGALTDPTLELRDQNGALIRSNDNWKSTQRSEIGTIGLPPAEDLEAALVAILPTGNYTAILAGASGSGIGLVELYNLR